MDLLLFGMQGAGKGTQGKIMAKEFGLAYFETGGELRKIASTDSELGRKVKSIIDAGHLVPNEVVMEIVADFLNKLPKGKSAIFDGIPRNREQTTSLMNLLAETKRPYRGILFDIPRGVAEERLLKRRICSKCKKVFPPKYSDDKCFECGGALTTRADDTAESIRTRLDTFEKETLPIIEDLRARGKIIVVNSNQEIDETYQELLKQLKIHLA